MLPTHDIDVGWKTTVSNVTLPLSRDIVRQASRLVVQAANAFTTEHTAAMRLLGVPSGIWRLDCTLVDQDGQGVTLYQPSEDAFYPPAGTVQMYEAEDRPLGLGLLTAMSPDFDARLELLRRSWPPLRVVVHPGLENDDHVWLGRDRVHHGLEALPADGFVIVRADPGLREYHPLSFRGWSTVITEGKKAYGDRMKIWRLVHRVEDLPRTHLPLVLKPLRGRRGEGLVIAAGISGPKTPDMVSREEAEQALLSNPAGMYLQPWHPPLRFDGRNLILRIFFGTSQKTGWRCLGGAWALDNKAVVHGSATTIFGPAVPV